MNHKIVKELDNQLLDRKEYLIEIESIGNPKFDDVKSLVKGDEDLIVIKKLKGNYGQGNFVADIVVYNSAESKKRIEKVPQKVRKKMAEEEKQKAEQEKKAKEEAAKAEEAKQEENKEASAEEAKEDKPEVKEDKPEVKEENKEEAKTE